MLNTGPQRTIVTVIISAANNINLIDHIIHQRSDTNPIIIDRIIKSRSSTRLQYMHNV